MAHVSECINLVLVESEKGATVAVNLGAKIRVATNEETRKEIK